MTRRRITVGLLVFAVLLVGLGIFFARTDLGRGSQVASVLSLFLNAVGVVSGMAGALVGWLAWRDNRPSAAARSPGTGAPQHDSAHPSSIRTGDLRAGGNISIANRDMYFGGDYDRRDASKRSER